jgi:hypothetical protein
MTLTFILLVFATAVNGIVAGASLDQAIKQLPARQRIGSVLYSRYSQAADLGNGIPWYVSLGISAVLLSLGAAVAAFFQQLNMEAAWPIYAAVVLSVLYSLITSQAAPTLFSQRRHSDEAELKIVFDRFARLNAVRAFLQVLCFATLMWALIIYPR